MQSQDIAHQQSDQTQLFDSSRDQRRYHLIGAICLVCAMLTTVLLHPSPSGAAQCSMTGGDTVAVGHCAPNFTLKDLVGHNVRLSAYRGHPVLLNFWGVGCTTCAAELPDLKKFAASFMKHRGVILGVNTWGEDPAIIAMYARLSHIAWTLLPDPPTTVGDLYGVRGTPTNVFVDKQGVVRHLVIGPLNAQQFNQDAQSL